MAPEMRRHRTLRRGIAFAFVIAAECAAHMTGVYSAPVSTITAKFVRRVTREGATDRVEGTLHYHADSGRVTVVLSSPVQQWIVADDKGFTVYYPVERKAFRFTGHGPVSAPCGYVVLALKHADLGLTKDGFSLVGKETVRGVLRTRWSPPASARTLVGAAVLSTEDDRVISLELSSPKGTSVLTVAYSRHIRHKGTHVPLHVVATQTVGSSETVETLSLHDPTFDEPLPSEIVHFKLPSGVIVTEVDQ